jgi:hypothetical protein
MGGQKKHSKPHLSKTQSTYPFLTTYPTLEISPKKGPKGVNDGSQPQQQT